MWMALLYRFVFSKSIELSSPLIASTTFLFPSQQHFFLLLVNLSLNTCSLIILLIVVTLTSTTFTSTMNVYVSTTSWTFTTITNFPWNILCILTNFGQYVILCPFKPQMWHAYENVFYVFWLSCETSVVTIVVYYFFFLQVSTLWLSSHNLCNVCQSSMYYFVFLLVLPIWYFVVLTMHSLLLQ